MQRLLALEDPFISNIAGLILSVLMLYSASKKFRSFGKLYEKILLMVCLSIYYCGMELIESFLSGTPGPLVHFILYIICTTLYLAVMVLAYTGTTLIVEHLGYELEEKRRWLLRCPIYYGCVVDCVK